MDNKNFDCTKYGVIFNHIANSLNFKNLFKQISTLKHIKTYI